MKTALFAAAALFALAALPAHAASASCDMLIGSPTSDFLSVASAGVDGVESCWVAVPDGATHVSTSSTDATGLYDVDLWFVDGSGSYDDGSCATTAVDESCDIPAGTAWVEVDGALGVMIHSDITFS